jgi:hypothetical protein
VDRERQLERQAKLRQQQQQQQQAQPGQEDQSVILQEPLPSEFINHFPNLSEGSAAAANTEDGNGAKRKAGRRKIPIEFIDDKSRRQITFSKRKAGLMKKAYELTTLTGTQALLLVASETGHVYTFATPKLQPFVTIPEGKSLIQACLNAPDPHPIGAQAAAGQPQGRPQSYETGGAKRDEDFEQSGTFQGQQEQPPHWGAPSALS